MFGKSSKNGLCTVCTVTSVILGVVGAVAAIASIIGVYKAHYPIENGGFVFGSTAGSLALIALIVNLFFMKKMSGSCPCQCSVSKK